MGLSTVFNRSSGYTLVLGLWLLSLSGCQRKNPESTFDSDRQYRHALFKGGYETIMFKPNGSVFVKMLINGVDVIANGNYERGKFIKVKLPDGPQRNLVFLETPDKKLISFDTNHRWERF
ncbi:hypothetical protein [Spirosoma horti]